MIDAEKQAQGYHFSDHGLKAAHPTQTGGYGFVLRLFGDKAVNDIRTSIIAKDLLSVLQGSETAMGLTESWLYEFEMDRNHVLHVKREEPPVEEANETKDEQEPEALQENDASNDKTQTEDRAVEDSQEAETDQEDSQAAEPESAKTTQPDTETPGDT